MGTPNQPAQSLQRQNAALLETSAIDPPMKPRDLPALTIVRFFAALVVALSHYALFGLRESPVWLRNIVSSGYLGVPFFFILSGFVLVYASDGAPLDKWQFWVRRAARIYPIYLLA